MASAIKALLGVAKHLTDKEIEDLAKRMDDELVGGDATGTLRALRSLGQGHTGKPPADLDPLD